MTRAEAIALISRKLAAFDDERGMTVADIVPDMDTAVVLPRKLADRELALIEQSKADFRNGRTYPIDEVRAHSDAQIVSLRAKDPAAPCHAGRSPFPDLA